MSLITECVTLFFWTVSLYIYVYDEDDLIQVSLRGQLPEFSLLTSHSKHV